MENNLCVLIDFENIAAGCEKEGLGRFNIQAVLNRLKDKGRILEARAYGDWGRFARFKQSLLESNVNMMELTSYRGQDKNRADIAMVVDAMELAFTRDYIDTFVVLSGDSDFTPLVTRLRAMNKRVIGCGTRGSTSRLIISAVDEFIFYESLAKRKAAPKAEEQVEADTDKAISLSKEDVFDLLVETLAGLQKDNPQPVLAGLVKQSMQRKAPAFNEPDFGYSGFARFLEAARTKGLVSLSKAERAGGYQVDQPRGDDDLDTGDEDSDDDLPVLKGESLRLQTLLANKGFSPATHMMRHAVVHEFIEHVRERTDRNRKNTLKYTVGDTARRCRKSDPPVATRHVRSVINAMNQCGLLLHSDGTPIRSTSAPFNIEDDAEECLNRLLTFYLQTLKSVGEALTDGEALSLVLYGDTDHTAELNQAVTDLAPLAKVNVDKSAATEAQSGDSEQEAVSEDTDDAEPTASVS